MTERLDPTDLFATPVDELPVPPAEPDLSTLVGPNGKYKTQEEALKALVYSQRHIDRLEQEQALLRQDLNTRLTLEEFMTKVSSTDNTARAQVPDPGSIVPPAPDALTTEKVAALIKASKEEDRRIANATYVQQKLKEKFGSDYHNSLNSQTSALGLSPADVNDMAANKPKALLALLGVTAGEPPLTRSAPPASAIDTTRTPLQQQGRDHAYYSNLRRTDPKMYYLPKTQLQMLKDLS